MRTSALEEVLGLAPAQRSALLATFIFDMMPGFRCPMSTGRNTQAAEVVSSGSVPAAGKPAPHRVLLVEDHAALAEATAELMRFHGLEVRVASTARDALEMAEEFRPALILCDLMLPDMAGLDAAQALRERCGANDPLIAMITAMGADVLRQFERHAKPRGVNLFLSKPLTNETLIVLLSKLDAPRPR
jgi:CheY-like chemotaxis protein